MASQEITENRAEIEAAEKQVLSRLDEICRIANNADNNSDVCDSNLEVAFGIDCNQDAMSVICKFCPDIAREVALGTEGNWDAADEVLNVISVFLVASALAKPTKAKHKEKPEETAKKFTPPLAKLLIFNLEGKAVEDIDFRDDCAYLAKKGFHYPASAVDLVPHMQWTDWMKENSSKTDQELDKAFNALRSSPNHPRWVDRVIRIFFAHT
jgi:hypothetical protein